MLLSNDMGLTLNGQQGLWRAPEAEGEHQGERNLKGGPLPSSHQDGCVNVHLYV